MYTCNGIYIPKEISKFTNTEPVPTNQPTLNNKNDLLSLADLLIKESLNNSPDQNNDSLITPSKFVTDLLILSNLLLNNENIPISLYNDIGLIISNFIDNNHIVTNEDIDDNLKIINNAVSSNTFIPSNIFLKHLYFIHSNVYAKYYDILEELFINIIPNYVNNKKIEDI